MKQRHTFNPATLAQSAIAAHSVVTTISPGQSARIARQFDAVGATQMRRDRARGFWTGAAIGLTVICTVLLLWLIFGWAMAKAIADAATAPRIMTF